MRSVEEFLDSDDVLPTLLRKRLERFNITAEDIGYMQVDCKVSAKNGLIFESDVDIRFADGSGRLYITLEA